MASNLMRDLLRNDPAGTVVGSLDMKNAFNSVFRSAFLRAIQADPRLRPLLPIASALYCLHSTLFVLSGGTIQSENGVRQGCVLGAVLFCIAIQPILQKLARDFPRVNIKAYLDDINFAGPRDDCIGFVQAATAAFAEVGLEVKLEKCVALDTLGAASPFHNIGFKNVSSDAVGLGDSSDEMVVRILGTSIGINDEVESRWCRDRARALHTWFDNVVNSDIPLQVKLTLLGWCGTPKWNHMCRSHSPAATLDGCVAFDDMVQRAVALTLDVEPDDLPESVFRPFTHGGGGFIRTTLTRSGAYTSSCESCQYWALPAEARSSDNPSAPKKPPPQHFINVPLWDAAATLDVLTVHDRVLHNHNALVGSNVTSLPRRRDQLMSDEECKVDFSLRHGVAKLAPQHDVCNCDSEIEPEQKVSHILACKHVRYFTKIHRHEMIIAALRETLRQYDIVTFIPETGYVEGTDKKPDLCIALQTGTVVIDVSVVHPCAPSYLDDEIARPLSSLAKRDAVKLSKYTEAATKHGHEMIGFICSSLGVWHASAKNLVTRCVREASRRSGLPARQISYSFWTALDSALRKGNARVITTRPRTAAPFLFAHGTAARTLGSQAELARRKTIMLQLEARIRSSYAFAEACREHNVVRHNAAANAAAAANASMLPSTQPPPAQSRTQPVLHGAACADANASTTQRNRDDLTDTQCTTPPPTSSFSSSPSSHACGPAAAVQHAREETLDTGRGAAGVVL